MPIITLTTDFGSADHFVGTMKGVILGIAPRANIVDITHQVAPYNVSEAAFTIAQAWPYFPKGTIHVVVVDPGVGSARRAILAQAGGQYFVAPDNGVLSMICETPRHQVRIIANAKLMGKEVSRTFHGRDVFAPAAAHLAAGVAPARFGKTIDDYVRASFVKPHKSSRGYWIGVVLKADHFGNLVTNFHIDNFPDIKTNPIELRAARERIHRLALTYSETEIGEVFAIVGSSGYIEIAANQASAAKILGCGAGAEVALEISR
jgi:S-adenosyl-L-methionine hydrolase (adenosine-forming)